MDRCWYVTESWGIHDERWTSALHAQGFDPQIISLKRDHVSVAEVRSRLVQAAEKGDPSPVLAGPLTTVASHLLAIPQRLVGLSWGFDLLDPQASPLDLAELDHVIVDSPASAEIAESSGVSANNTSTIYWGTDLDAFTPEGPRMDLSTFHVPAHARVVLSLRAHEQLYRVADLLDAWPGLLARHPDAHLLLGNQGSRTPELESHARELKIGGNVHFIGRIPEADLAPLLRSVDLYVSTSPVDGTSVTMLQAMATGCPVLVTDIPGNRNWIQSDSTGYLYASGDARSLSSAVDAALTNAGTAKQQTLIATALDSVRDRADWNHNQQLLRAALLPH